MVKRVSLKGKGVELFFGDTPPLPPPELTPTAVAPASSPEPPPTPEPECPLTSEARVPASTHARKQASKQVSKRNVAAPTTLDDMLPAIYDQVAARATITNTFRYTDGELVRLADALYQISKRHRVKLTKQDVARLGLNAVLWDYETRGNQSLLMQLALRKKREPGGDS